uniref:Putative secreted peptide n=1 Tax=Anopheles braziliensis TaxID=58242 RepID=A0A2M3ZXA1_9DIPT
MKHITLISLTTCVLLFINCFHTLHSAPTEPEQQGGAITNPDPATLGVPKLCPDGCRPNGKNICTPIRGYKNPKC